VIKQRRTEPGRILYNQEAEIESETGSETEKIQVFLENHKRNFRNNLILNSLGLYENFRSYEYSKTFMNSQSLTSLAPISSLPHTQEREPARTEYRIHILNSEFEFEFSQRIFRNCNFLRNNKLNTRTPKGEHLDDLPPVEPPSAQAISPKDSTPVTPEHQDQLQRVSRLLIFQIYFILNTTIQSKIPTESRYFYRGLLGTTATAFQTDGFPTFPCSVFLPTRLP
jgi:hypothetical protein